MGVEMGWSTEPEAVEFLAALIRMTNRKSVLELGTFNGETARAMARTDAEVFSIDIANERITTTDGFTFLHGDSRTFDYGVRCFDLIYFDSDHCQDQLFAEFYHLRGAMTEDCILAFHDTIMFPEVREFILLQESCQIIRPVTLPTPRGCGLTIATLL